MKYDSYIVFSSHYNEPLPQIITIDSVGLKAVGLFNCNPTHTPPFFVLTSAFYKKWEEDQKLAKHLLQEILAYYSNVLEKDSISFIVRSSAKHESFEERGYYKSSTGNIKFNRLYQNIINLCTDNSGNIRKYQNNEFAIIIQQYIEPKLSGHLSNERRISRNKNEWLIEISDNKHVFLERHRFKAPGVVSDTQGLTLSSSTKKNLIAVLKKITASLTIEEKRYHIEWVWDGVRGWIVQNDLEITDYTGTEPSSEWKKRGKLIDNPQFSIFTTVNTTEKEWKKMFCVKTFIECDLPFGNVYILEKEEIIENLAKKIIDPQLKNELSLLLTSPILIRMDIIGHDNILLPRTETVFTIDDAIKFLHEHSQNFISQGVSANNFCFLIHRFIISKSCALAFSKPNIQKARIDSTWGIVEGLYYHPHDSFEVNLMSKSKKITKQIRCKTEYLDVDNNGKWFSKKAGKKWDWAESLSQEQIYSIAEFNVKIADHLDSAVTVMYFVDVDPNTGYPSILPWFYTTEEVTESSERFTDIIFSENREMIENMEDFDQCKKRWDHIKNPKITFKLKMQPDLLRNKKIIEDIGEYSKEKNIPIELEGSILAHTYYILRKIGAHVKCSDPFEPKYKKQKFYKLVRDKIPVNIEQKGETARVIKVDSNELLNFLKNKAIEEAYEFYWEKEEDKIIEELADLFEVIRASVKAFGITMEELQKIADKKTEKKGGFEAGVLLVDTTETSLIDVIDGRGNSLLINKDPEEKPKLGKVRKPKQQKILFGVDNSITLPYALGIGKSSIEDLEAPVSLEDIEGIKISYTNKGIKIKFTKKSEEHPNDAQLDLFGNSL